MQSPVQSHQNNGDMYKEQNKQRRIGGLWASLAGGGLEIWLPAPVSSLTCYVNLSSNVALHVLQMVDGTVEYMRYLCDLVKTQLYGF